MTRATSIPCDLDWPTGSFEPLVSPSFCLNWIECSDHRQRPEFDKPTVRSLHFPRDTLAL